MFIDADAANVAVKQPWTRVDDPALAQLARYPVALIGDTRLRMGMMRPGIRPVTRTTTIVGTVLPVATWEGDNLAIHRALDEAQPGDVLVVDANGVTERSVFGDILAEICLARGVAGAVVDGAIRDVAEMDIRDFPVYARAVTPAGPSKHGPGTVGYPVSCGGVVCNPGDILVADADGIIVLPAEELAATLRRTTAQDEVESQIRLRIAETARDSDSPFPPVHRTEQ